MSRPLLVGITGGIGAGKSTVAKIFTTLGVPHYDSDSRAKSLMTTAPNIMSGLRVLFGDESIIDGHLNRELIAKKSFEDPKKLAQLNELVHPEVGRDFENWISEHAHQKYLLKEAALIFETGIHKSLDKVILVTAPLEMRIDRVLRRDAHRSRKDVEAIMAKQMPESEKESLADVVLRNDDSALLIPQVLELHEQFSSTQIPS